MILILTLQLPTFVLISSLEQALENQIDNAVAKQGAFSDLEDQVKHVNTLVDHLAEQADEGVQFSELIYELDAVAPQTVALTQFSMSRERGTVHQIEVVGAATTRTALANFRDAIEEHELFGEAELPISNLAKDRDIVFAMTITMAEAE